MNQQVLFEVNQESVNTSFCNGCGSYIPADKMRTAHMDTGKMIICCPDCKRSAYKDRIQAAVKAFYGR